MFLKGLHYRCAEAYRVFTFLKLWNQNTLRFLLAVQRIRPGERVLDVCSGPGDLRHFLPPGCRYAAVDASPEFLDLMNSCGVRTYQYNLHSESLVDVEKSDIVVMIISLCQFSRPVTERILKELPKIAARVLIVEEVGDVDSWGYRARAKINDYLCARDFCGSFRVMSPRAFSELMTGLGYGYRQVTKRYAIGEYPPEQEK